MTEPIPSVDSPSIEPADATTRRRFLAAAGVATCGALSVSLPETAQGQETASAVDPNSGMEGIKKLFARKEPVCWVITGDSITHGALHTLGWRSYPEHFAERVRWEMRRVRDLVINTGISGDRTGGLLADIDWRALHLRPTVVSVMLGMNDCSAGVSGRETFRQNLAAIVAKIKDAGAIPLLNTPNTVYVKNAGGREDLSAYAQIVREVASATKTALIDHWVYWEKEKPNQEALLKWIEDKSIHPGVYGHRAFARLMFRELGIFDAASPTCQLEVP